MKTNYLAVVVFALTTLCFNVNAQNFVAPTNKNIIVEGRTVVDNSVLRYDYPGTAFTMSFTGTSVKAKLKPEAGYYTANVDGKEIRIDTHKDQSGIYTLANNLSQGNHTVTLTLISEGLFVKPEFRGFEIDNDAKVLKTKPKKLLIEFIGNSITCGYGVEAANGQTPFNDSTSNQNKTYAAIVANYLNARKTVVARSGIGVYKNFGDSLPSKYPMPKIYQMPLISNSMDGNQDLKWDFSQSKPNIVCICLGTNDMSMGQYDYEKFQLAYVAFVKEVRKYYPAAKIVLLNSPMLHDQASADLYNAITNTINAMRVLGDSRIYRFDFVEQDDSLGYGADWHPSAKRQSEMGRYLTTFIKNNVLNK